MINRQTWRMRKIAGDYLRQFECLLHKVDLDAFERIAQHLRIAREEGRFVYIAGNGGSAATASHFANDLGKVTKDLGCKRMRVMSLSDNVSCLTALANDRGYEHIFSGQLENFAQHGDLLVVISASGNSPNLLRAVELARARGLLTIGFLGFDGGVLKDKVDECLWLPTEKGEYGLVESGHGLLCHILATCLLEDRSATFVESLEGDGITKSGQLRELLHRPTQAVILAGGRGTRMRPLTDTCPKAMIEIHGKPFLEYLVEMLQNQGFERILLLLGYLPEVIQDYFKDGSRWGVRIDYSVSAAEDGTARRVRLAESYLDPCFLLMYCDNYWPMQMEKMWQRFVSAKVPAMVTIYSNKDNYSKSSVRVDPDGYVSVFDRTRTTPNLQGVEISYAILSRSVVELLPEDPTVLFEEVVYPRLVERRQLLAYMTDHRYYSVGAYDRLPLTEAFLARQPAIILDRDGVINKKPPKAQYVRTWEEFEWVPGVKDALRLLKKANYRVIVVSNQAGIGRGAMTEVDLQKIHERMLAEVSDAGGQIEAFYYCPHDWDEGCECRKPKPGLLFQAQHELNLDLTRTLFIGDDERDAQAADAAGCPSALVTPEVSLIDIIRKVVNNE